uniref:Uncharacterized protein n=1 Tax=Romanomermis culicivorax TaxID=13658 RepID=A0A915HEK9_ROMCU
MQAHTSAAHSVTSDSDAVHQNTSQRGETMSETGAHLRNDFPQRPSISALGTHHQKVFQQGALTSASCAHLYTTPYKVP